MLARLLILMKVNELKMSVMKSSNQVMKSSNQKASF